MKVPFDKDLLPQDFHMPGIEPYIAGLLEQQKLGIVLDIGVGLGFWGYLIRSYIMAARDDYPVIIGVDLKADTLCKLKEMRIYNELICADARCLPFKARSFDTIISIESLYWPVDITEALTNIVGLAKDEGLIIFSRGLNRNVRAHLLSRGYELFEVYLRGLMLKSLRDGKEFFANDRLKWLAFAIKFFQKWFKLKYVIGLKRV